MTVPKPRGFSWFPARLTIEALISGVTSSPPAQRHLAFLPVVFLVQAKRNFRIGFVVHAIFNLTGVLTLFLRG